MFEKYRQRSRLTNIFRAAGLAFATLSNAFILVSTPALYYLSDNELLGRTIRIHNPESLPLRQKDKCAWRILQNTPISDVQRGKFLKSEIGRRLKKRLNGHVPKNTLFKRKAFEVCNYMLK